MKKFIFSKFRGLQAYSWQLYYQMNSFRSIFQQHFKPTPCFEIAPTSNCEVGAPPPRMFSTPVGNPAAAVLIISKVFTILCLLCPSRNREYPGNFQNETVITKLYFQRVPK